MKRNVLWFLVGAAILLSHALIPHKEYRFIYPALLCLIVAAALGSADLIQNLARAHRRYSRLAFAAAMGFWISISLTLSLRPGYSSNWVSSNELLRASYFTYNQPDLCGLLFDYIWGKTGGYAYLHRSVPIYDLRSEVRSRQDVIPLVNYIITPSSEVLKRPESYELIKCINEERTTGVCILKRQGPCSRNPGLIPLGEESGLGEIKAVSSLALSGGGERPRLILSTKQQ